MDTKEFTKNYPQLLEVKSAEFVDEKTVIIRHLSWLSKNDHYVTGNTYCFYIPVIGMINYKRINYGWKFKNID